MTAATEPVAIVAGAALDLVQQLTSERMTATVLGLDEARPAAAVQTVEEAGGAAAGYAADVSDEVLVQKAVTPVADDSGH